MGATSERLMRGWIDAHFAGRLGPRREQMMREHLAGCEGCRRYYRRHLMLERVDPRAIGRDERLARGLGLRPRRSLSRPLAAAAAAGLVGLALLVALRPFERDQRYSARGKTSNAVALQVYALAPDRSPRPVEGHIAATDELAFGYLNAAGKTHLMVLGVDETGEIYWYHPAWLDPEKDPAAIAIRPAFREKELAEAIAHDYRGRRLRILALFLDRALTVRQVEATVRKCPRADRLPIPGSLQHTLSLEVRR